MQTVQCPLCKHSFEYDPNAGSTLPGVRRQTRVPIQCVKCKKWITVEIIDDDTKDNRTDK